MYLEEVFNKAKNDGSNGDDEYENEDDDFEADEDQFDALPPDGDKPSVEEEDAADQISNSRSPDGYNMHHQQVTSPGQEAFRKMMMESQTSEDLNFNNEKWKQMLAADSVAQDPSYEENKDFSVELRERHQGDNNQNESMMEENNNQDNFDEQQQADDNEEEDMPPCNEIYVWGDDSRGQLGLSGIFGDEKTFVTPQICSFNVVIKQLSCGLHHTIFAADSGFLYSMGCNQYGQLGIGDKESLNQSSPTLIAALLPQQQQHLNDSNSPNAGITPRQGAMITQISCGLNHSLALTEDGEVYAWGQGAYGALGTGAKNDVFEPTWVSEYLDDPVIQLSAGGYHSAFVTMSGALYICGNNSKGQLGVNLDSDMITDRLFMTLQEESGVSKVACGEMHTMVLLKDNTVLTCGSNELMQLGHDNLSERVDFSPEFEKVEALSGIKIVDISCWNMCACIDADKNLYLWGTIQDTESENGIAFQMDQPEQMQGLQVAKVEVSKSSIAIVESPLLNLKLINCNQDPSQFESTATFTPQFTFMPIEDIKEKRISLLALGKSGFVVAIGDLQQPEQLANTIRIEPNNNSQRLSLSIQSNNQKNKNNNTQTEIRVKQFQSSSDERDDEEHSSEQMSPDIKLKQLDNRHHKRNSQENNSICNSQGLFKHQNEVDVSFSIEETKLDEILQMPADIKSKSILDAESGLNSFRNKVVTVGQPTTMATTQQIQVDKQIVELQNTVAELQFQIEEKEQLVTQKQQHIQDFQSKVEREQEKLAEFEGKSQEYERKIIELECQIKNQEATITDLQDKLNVQSKLIEKLQEKNDQNELELVNKDQRIEELSKQAMDLEAKLALKIQEINAAHIEVMDTLQNRMRESDETILELNQQINNNSRLLETVKQDHSIELEVLRHELQTIHKQDLESKAKSFEEELHNKELEIAKLTEQALLKEQQMKEEIQQAETLYLQAFQEHQERESGLLNLIDSLKEQLSQIDTLRAENAKNLADYQEVISHLKLQITSKEEANIEVKEQLKALEQQKQQLEERLTNHEENNLSGESEVLTEMRAELKKQSEQLLIVTNQLQNEQSLSIKKQDEINELKQTQLAKDLEMQSIRNDIEKKTTESISQVGKYQEENEKLKSQIQQQSQDLIQLQIKQSQELQAVKAQYKQLKDELSCTEQKLITKEQEYQASIMEKDEAIKLLKSELPKRKSEEEQSSENIQEVLIVKSKKSPSKTGTALPNQNEEAQTIIEQSQALAEKDKQIEQLAKQIVTLQNELTDLKEDKEKQGPHFSRLQASPILNDISMLNEESLKKKNEILEKKVYGLMKFLEDERLKTFKLEEQIQKQGLAQRHQEHSEFLVRPLKIQVDELLKQNIDLRKELTEAKMSNATGAQQRYNAQIMDNRRSSAPDPDESLIKLLKERIKKDMLNDSTASNQSKKSSLKLKIKRDAAAELPQDLFIKPSTTVPSTPQNIVSAQPLSRDPQVGREESKNRDGSAARTALINNQVENLKQTLKMMRKGAESGHLKTNSVSGPFSSQFFHGQSYESRTSNFNNNRQEPSPALYHPKQSENPVITLQSVQTQRDDFKAGAMYNSRQASLTNNPTTYSTTDWRQQQQQNISQSRQLVSYPVRDGSQQSQHQPLRMNEGSPGFGERFDRFERELDYRQTRRTTEGGGGSLEVRNPRFDQNTFADRQTSTVDTQSRERDATRESAKNFRVLMQNVKEDLHDQLKYQQKLRESSSIPRPLTAQGTASIENKLKAYSPLRTKQPDTHISHQNNFFQHPSAVVSPQNMLPVQQSLFTTATSREEQQQQYTKRASRHAPSHSTYINTQSQQPYTNSNYRTACNPPPPPKNGQSQVASAAYYFKDQQYQNTATGETTDRSVRQIIQEGGSLIEGIRSKLQTLEKNKMDLQAKINNFENKMMAMESNCCSLRSGSAATRQPFL